MRFVCYDALEPAAQQQLGVEIFGVIYNLPTLVKQVATVTNLPAPPPPHTIWEYHALPQEQKQQLTALVQALPELLPEQRGALIQSHVRRLPPVSAPHALRCFSTFEEHTKIVRQRRGLSMPTEWYEMPVFFFGNHNALYGHGAEIPQPASFWLDYEMQVACVIGQQGRNIPAAEAETYIAGYTILNDWCARDLEMFEMKMGLGPAKGRDFATSVGPTLVTPDELESYAIGDGAQRRYDLTLEASINGQILGNTQSANLSAMHFTFAQMIEYASTDAMLYPGDILASGAVPGGSLLSIGAEEMLGRWLQPGDVVDLEATGLGVLRNTVTTPQV
ncbi:fumarylacetoacetate hydrolase family protein [Chloroflexota bacterium]